MESNFDRWDANQNGQISWSEVRQRVSAPECEGEEAVALATLYGLVSQDSATRGLERNAPVTYNRLFDLYHEYSDDDGEPIADALYQKYQSKLDSSTDVLFAQDLPNGFSGKQGTAPSCGFLATTFSQMTKNPGVVKDTITELEDGKLQVKFPGLHKPVTITPVTDTEQALFATASGDGSWLTTLEKAWGTHLAGGDSSRAFEMTTNPEDAIRAWTGKSAATARVPRNPQPTSKGELPEYLSTATRELAANHLVVTWTRFDDLSEEGLVPGHAYSMTGVDYEDGKVSLRNPWGSTEPQGKDGKALDGRDDGIFELSIDDFQKNFQKIARQTD